MTFATANIAGKRDGIQGMGTWTITDYTEDLAVDCDTDDANLGDAFGTLVLQLIQLGILKGSVEDK